MAYKVKVKKNSNGRPTEVVITVPVERNLPLTKKGEGKNRAVVSSGGFKPLADYPDFRMNLMIIAPKNFE